MFHVDTETDFVTARPPLSDHLRFQIKYFVFSWNLQVPALKGGPFVYSWTLVSILKQK